MNSNTGEIRNFPLDHISASAMIALSTNPVLFKIRYVNRDQWDVATSVSAVIGKAFHAGMEAYYGERYESERSALDSALTAATDYLEKYPEAFIKFTSTVQNKQKAQEIVAFTVESYVAQHQYHPDSVAAVEDGILEDIALEWNGQQIELPVPMKGYIDRVEQGAEEGAPLKLYDYKVCANFSDPEKIDGAKIIQSIAYYLLAHAKYGRAPHSITYEEVKMTKNRDGSPQVRKYEVVYADNEQFFEFFFRYYTDFIRAMNGEAVFLPNVHALFDNEVAIIAYVHRLDEPEERARLLKKNQVETITDLLKAEIANAGNMRRLLKAAEKIFVSAKTLNYSLMNPPEKIQKKLMEHGIIVQFDSVVEGSTVDLYRYTPSIGIKMSKLRGFAADIEQVLGVSGVRVLAPIPNSTFIGFEVPRVTRSYPSLPTPAKTFELAIGQDVMGSSSRFDIRTAPHMLVAGASGSGKSVFLSSLIAQLAVIPNVELTLYDPKRIEMAREKKLAREYENSPEAIWHGLRKLEVEMEKRYEMMEKAGARTIEGLAPYRFVVIDEFGELMVNDAEVVLSSDEFGEEKKIRIGADIERSILRLAQMARAAGIHLIIATQRPSVDIIKGTIKANFPTKVVFRTAKATDSRVIMDEDGAEKLLGRGDMFFVSDSGTVRLQGYNL